MLPDLLDVNQESASSLLTDDNLVTADLIVSRQKRQLLPRLLLKFLLRGLRRRLNAPFSRNEKMGFISGFKG